jgi:hypothetical protein
MQNISKCAFRQDTHDARKKFGKWDHLRVKFAQNSPKVKISLKSRGCKIKAVKLLNGKKYNKKLTTESTYTKSGQEIEC